MSPNPIPTSAKLAAMRRPWGDIPTSHRSIGTDGLRRVLALDPATGATTLVPWVGPLPSATLTPDEIARCSCRGDAHDECHPTEEETR